MRGMQIAATRPDWKATNHPSAAEIIESDVVCIVKKTHKSVVETSRNNNKLIVLDVVDFWPQPKVPNRRVNRRESEELVIGLIDEIRPDALIFPNHAMWADYFKAFPSIPSTFIYHHYRPAYDSISLEFSPFRPRILAYEGGDYLAEWYATIVQICEELGLDFTINPKSLEDVDCLLSVRGEQFQTYLNGNYKSNVKAANAIGILKPFVCLNSERSAHETDPGSFMFFDDPDSLRHQLGLLVSDLDYLKFNHEQMLLRRPYFSLESIASEFELFLYQVLGYYGRGADFSRNIGFGAGCVSS